VGSISSLRSGGATPAPLFIRVAGPIAILVAAVAIAAARFHPALERSMAGRGIVAVALNYDLALPLIGLGLAIGGRRRDALLGAVPACLGLWLGFAARDWLIAAIVTGPGTAVRLNLPAPIACLAVGLALAAPPRFRTLLLPPAALVLGTMLGLAVKFADPSFHDPSFLRAAVGAAIWLIAAVALAARPYTADWLRIATRIFGSWLIAIGGLLAAAILVPRSALQPPMAAPMELFPSPVKPPDLRRQAPAGELPAPPDFPEPPP
jgi:hypothetical protein